MNAAQDLWMAMTEPLILGALAIGFLIWLVVWIERRNRTVPDDPALWPDWAHSCPKCGAPMSEGWVLLGKGAIWSDRAAGRPGSFASIGKTLPNTLSLRLRPAANMGWRCERCRVLTIDYDKLVGK
jgi:hypothetical protein